MDRTLKRTSSIIAAIGLLDALYLSWVKLSNNEAACLPGLGDCTAVNLSRYSEILGVPIAVLGSGAFLTILAALFLEGRFSISSEISQFVIFSLSLIGTIYSVYLTYLEIYVIRAICPYCVISAVALAALLSLTLVRILRQNRNEP